MQRPPGPMPSVASYEAFLDHVRARLEVGRDVFQDRSLERSGPELLTEIQEELADVAGWSALLWVRLERLRRELRHVDPGPDHGTAVPAALVGPDRQGALDALSVSPPAPGDASSTPAGASPEAFGDQRARAIRVMGGRRE